MSNIILAVAIPLSFLLLSVLIGVLCRKGIKKGSYFLKSGAPYSINQKSHNMQKNIIEEICNICSGKYNVGSFDDRFASAHNDLDDSFRKQCQVIATGSWRIAEGITMDEAQFREKEKSLPEFDLIQ